MLIGPLDTNKNNNFKKNRFMPESELQFVRGDIIHQIYRDDISTAKRYQSISNQSHVSRAVRDAGGEMAFMIINTDAFKIAEQMMRQYPDWLNQLYMIPSSYRNAETFWGEFTGKNEQNLINTFNNAMSAISQLVQQFRAWQNSLPAEQVSQLTEAGINAAVTGTDISSSSMSDTSGVIPSQQEVSNPVDIASSLVSTVGGFVSFASEVLTTFSDLKTADIGRAHTAKQIAQIENAINLAVENQWNATELHEYLLSELGLKSTNPNSHLNSDDSNSTILDATEKIAKMKKRVESNSLAANPLNVDPDSDVSVVGANGDEIIKGTAFDVFSQLSQFSLVEWYYNQLSSSLQNYITGNYLNLTYELQGQYLENSVEAQNELNVYLQDFYRGRSGFTEGLSTTRLSQFQASIAEANTLALNLDNSWNTYKLNHFGNMIRKGVTDWRYSPFIMKALYGVDIQDSLFHDPYNPFSSIKSGYKQFFDLIKGMNLF